jgi:hypothetical protein
MLLSFFKKKYKKKYCRNKFQQHIEKDKTKTNYQLNILIKINYNYLIAKKKITKVEVI